MRDGARLFTAIYTPRDTIGKTYPILMSRTPYSVRPYGAEHYRSKLSYNQLLTEEKYIFVYQDVRGRYKSEGHFREMTPAVAVKKTKDDVDESSDTYDTIEWLLKNTPNNGNVGIYGISFPGFYATASLPDAHPALRAVSPQAPMSDEFIGDDCYHNGAFFLMDNFGFYSGFDGPKNADGEAYQRHFPLTSYHDPYQYFLSLGSLKKLNKAPYFSDPGSIWRQTTGNPVYNEYWQSRDIKRHLRNIRPAVLVVGGWFDAEDLYGALKTFTALDSQSPATGARLVMGPWTHGGWAAPAWRSFSHYRFGKDVNRYYQEHIELRFFNHYLKNKGEFSLPKVTVFETGSNEWKHYDTWPPGNSTPVAYYLHPGGGLSTGKPSARSGYSEYVSDPSRPVPYTGVIKPSRNNEYMAEDQRFAAMRPDVLVFSTNILDHDLTLTGEITADLRVTLSSTDADFVVKVIDAWPDNALLPVLTEGEEPVLMGGYQQLVRAEVLRGKFRDDFTNPSPFSPGKVENVRIRLNEVAHTFQKGHRVMIQIQSSWFPLVDRNPQKFMNIFEAEEDDFQKAVIRVHHDRTHSSHIELPVMK